MSGLRFLGDDHVITLAAMHNLALMLSDQRQLSRAAQILRKILENHKETLSKEYLGIFVTARDNLANVLVDQGCSSEAARIRNETFEMCQQRLGQDHSSTINTMESLVSTLRDQGRRTEAVQMAREVLELRRKQGDEEHPDVIRAMNNLAIAMHEQASKGCLIRDEQQLSEVALLQRELLDRSKRVLGEEDPNTLEAMTNLAYTIGRTGDPNEAISLLENATHKMEKIHFEDHPHLLQARSILESIKEEQSFLSSLGVLEGQESRIQVLRLGD